ncbi:MAG: signal peptidase I [Leucobacter sp.]|nr:signal peptidase I [Leucobacter sp.]
MARGAGRARGAVGNALLNIAALGGLVCIVLVLLSAFFNVSLIMFKTGSMSPTIPAGSLAVVREIPAADVQVGDVLTVDRPGMLPVTHRVTSVAGSGQTRTITMRGDANEAEDPAPYTVTEARLVLASVPNLARVVVWFSNPLVLGGLTIGASLLVTWAFWPRQPGGTVRGRGHPRHSATAAAATVFAVTLGCGITLFPAGGAPASAAPPVRAQASSEQAVRTVTKGAHITLTAIGDPVAMRTMRPGVPVPWQVGVRIDALDPGEVTVSLEAAGARELGLVLDVRECDTEWINGSCPGAETPVAGDGIIDAGVEPRTVTVLRSGAERWFLVSATIPAAVQGTVTLTLRAAGGSDIVTTGPGPIGALPATGARPAWLLGIGAVAAGLVAAGVARAANTSRWAGRPVAQ